MSTELKVKNWWRTSIIDMEPGKISFRGHPIQDLIGSVTFPEMIWLMVRGDLPSKGQASLLEMALVAAVDHGPQAPSIATARMAVTCGLSLNGALASAVNMLDDVHGGAGEQAVELYQSINRRMNSGPSVSGSMLQESVQFEVCKWRNEHGKYIPGFGHRFHKPVDPRAPKLMECVRDAQKLGDVVGEYVVIAEAIQEYLSEEKGKAIPMNIDGATAVIYAELGFPAQLARGLFCLSRSVGIVAHAWEQMEQGGRNKGPTPPEFRWTYEGH
jgi:citrate synthase